ncbi:MAG TPA: glycine cleavage system protein GcvH [Armatimonadota bacterium]|nr:glycine cleavage system protein GcvH [Armatimonadota bacterium]HOS42671.1 glycine cleavage system protein GcvH [Armatimonadota bacterium]
MYPDNLKYSEAHVWARVDDGIAVVGITHHAQDQLGDVVYVSLPQVGDDVVAGEVMGSVESVKTISDLYAPVSGRVIAINEPLLDEPGAINADPYGAGWMVKIEMSGAADYDNMLTAAEYQEKL